MDAKLKEKTFYWVFIAAALFLILASFIYPRDSPSPESRATPTLIEVAADHVRIAEATKGQTQLWGRIAGTDAERASADLLAKQLQPWVDEVYKEAFNFSAHRPKEWKLLLDGELSLESAMPAPFDARFPEQTPAFDIQHVRGDQDWPKVEGKWAFVEAEMQGSPGRTNIRRNFVYDKAVNAGAVGFIFSLPTPPGRWRAVVPVDKPYSKKDERYPDGFRPIPSFCIDAEDGAQMREAATRGATLACEITYHDNTTLQGHNVIATLEGTGDEWIALAIHLDSFFSGANDDASGMATLVGLAHRLKTIPKVDRYANFIFVGLSGHHDEAAGMRDFVSRDPDRMAKIDSVILLEHLDAVPGNDEAAEWPNPLNNRRSAYLGSQGWPAIREALPKLVRESGLMTVTPPMLDACIADLFIVCGSVNTFTLIQGPPYYHTDHDTLDKLTETGLQNAVEFHLNLLETIGAIKRSPSE